MIGEETCPSHALSNAKIMADFSEPPLNPGRKEARGSIEDPVSKDGARPSTLAVTRAKLWRPARSITLSSIAAQTTPGARIGPSPAKRIEHSAGQFSLFKPASDCRIVLVGIAFGSSSGAIRRTAASR
jgi:hypothetical protein